jgi:hypothetical protein
VRRRFWPLSGHRAVIAVLRSCVTCARAKPTILTPIIGNLPEVRVTPSRPFSRCGVDYAGPILIKEKAFRNLKFIKSYICIFVCLSTKAVHIELVPDLGTDSFMRAFKRFISRRGLCHDIHSDNGTNFVDANNELKRLLSSKTHQNAIQEYALQQGINWHFIPPRSPHFGGIWESAVKPAKHHLIRTLGNSHLTYEQLLTILTRIEACLNSRPLIPSSNDPNDLHPITPAHFLIGGTLLDLPCDSATTAPSSEAGFRRKHLHGQQLLQHFWGRWSREYLRSLQARGKRGRVHSDYNLKVGDLVLIHEDNQPPLRWNVGRIHSLHPGNDGVVRVVTIRTTHSLMKRAV